jgi:hypothetical protein
MEMDNITIKLQEFLDGSLPPEEEAELLHRLSVSPERRDLLRSYMKQQAVLNNDRATIAVPYEAEQKLWAALAVLPPAAAPIVSNIGTGAATAVATSSVFVKIASVALMSIVIGFASGYFIGNRPATDVAVTQVLPTPSVSNSIASVTLDPSSPVSVHEIGSNRAVDHRNAIMSTLGSSRRFTEAPLSDRIEMPSAFMANNEERSNDEMKSVNLEERISIPRADAFVPGVSFIRDPNAQPVDRPSIGELSGKPKRGARFTDYLELSIHEGIGKQFPNSEATNVSIPIVTNTDITMKFMIAPSFWVGAGFGLANMTHKNVYETMDAQTAGSKVAWNYEHRNTAWFGLLAEYRQPISSHLALTANGGIAASSLGPILSTELGMRYEVTESVGALAGVRMSRATSNVQAQYDALAKPQPGTPGLGNTDPSLMLDPSMINLEISTGIYFRF